MATKYVIVSDFGMLYRLTVPQLRRYLEGQLDSSKPQLQLGRTVGKCVGVIHMDLTDMYEDEAVQMLLDQLDS